MDFLLKILKGIFFIFILFFILFVNKNQELIASYLNIQYDLISYVVFILIFCIGIYYVNLLFKVDDIPFKFTSIVNHVFRTPLTRILWITKELEKDISQEEKKIYIQNLENSTNRVLDIVDILAGIKDIKNRESYFFQAVYIREIFEKSLSKYREKISEKKINFNLSSLRDIPMLTVDLKKISFVIDAVIENAIFYSKNSGNIEIFSYLKKNKIVIAVSDDGLGLDRKDKYMIFQKFYRGEKAKLIHTDGLGLGLYLSKIIIKRHGGRIYSKSKGRDMGTTFFIELPFSK